MACRFRDVNITLVLDRAGHEEQRSVLSDNTNRFASPQASFAVWNASKGDMAIWAMLHRRYPHITLLEAHWISLAKAFYAGEMKLNKVLAGMPGVVWIRSYISDTEGKIFCELDAPDKASLRERCSPGRSPLSCTRTANLMRANAADHSTPPVLPAFFAALPAALVLWMISLFLYNLVTAGATRAAGLVPYMIMGGVLFGLPVLIGMLVLVAAPLALLLRRFFSITLPITLAAGAVMGLVARAVVVVLWAEPETAFVPVPVALVTGIGTAWVWWGACRRRSDTHWASGGAV